MHKTKRDLGPDLCPDGATDEEHRAMLELTGQCPWCGAEEPVTEPLSGLDRLFDEYC